MPLYFIIYCIEQPEPSSNCKSSIKFNKVLNNPLVRGSQQIFISIWEKNLNQTISSLGCSFRSSETPQKTLTLLVPSGSRNTHLFFGIWNRQQGVFQLAITLLLFGVRSSTTPSKLPQSSHYVGRIRFLESSEPSLSRYSTKTVISAQVESEFCRFS